MLLIEQTILSLVVALACAAVPWLVRGLRAGLVAVGLALGIAVSILAAVLFLALYPWSNLLVTLVGLTGGLLLGRALPRRTLLALVLLLVLSALDALQIALTGGLTHLPAAPPATASAIPSGPLLLFNLFVVLPDGHYLLGIFDLLVLTALAEHWRRRGGTYLIALLPGLLGFALAEASVLLTRLGGWPLIPFFTVGWIASEVLFRATTKSDPLGGREELGNKTDGSRQ